MNSLVFQTSIAISLCAKMLKISIWTWMVVIGCMLYGNINCDNPIDSTSESNELFVDELQSEEEKSPANGQKVIVSVGDK